MNLIAYKFARWDVNPLEELKTSEVYRLKEKTLNGGKLTREEKDWLVHQVQNGKLHGNSAGVPLQGWMFDFKHVMERFFVRLAYGDIVEIWSPDRTAIRSYFGKHNVMEIR